MCSILDEEESLIDQKKGSFPTCSSLFQFQNLLHTKKQVPLQKGTAKMRKNTQNAQKYATETGAVCGTWKFILSLPAPPFSVVPYGPPLIIYWHFFFKEGGNHWRHFETFLVCSAGSFSLLFPTNPQHVHSRMETLSGRIKLPMCSRLVGKNINWLVTLSGFHSHFFS